MRKLNDRKKCNKAETSKTAEQDTDKYFRLRLSKKVTGLYQNLVIK